MHLIHTNFKTGTIKLKVTELDDLWYLHRIIDVGDLVSGSVARKIKVGSEEKGKVARKMFLVTIAAETIEFSDAGTSLRINGKIKEGPEDIPRESYQSISLEEGYEYTLHKEKWLAFQKQKLQEAAEKRYTFLLCLFDREEALIAQTTKSGYEILTTLKGEAQKKDRTINIQKDFQEEVITALGQYALRLKPERIILASPAFYKEDLFKKIASPELKKKIVLSTCSDISTASIMEVLKQPELASILKASRIREEEVLMEQLLKEINKERAAAYGWNGVQEAIDQGATAKILLTDTFIHQHRIKGDYDGIDYQLQKAESTGAEIHILSSEHEPGKQLNGLGGIAALLRYKLF